MKEIKSIDIMSYSKIMTILALVMAFVLGITACIYFAIQKGSFGALFTDLFILLALVVFPIMIAVLTFILSFIYGLVYNFAAEKVGGIKIELVDAE